jgi:hypothetical protein
MLQNEMLDHIDWTRDAPTEREAAFRAALLRGIDKSSRADETSLAFMLLTAYGELRAVGVPIERWGGSAADHLASDVRTFWTALARDAEASWSAAQERRRSRLITEALSGIEDEGRRDGS